MHSFKKPGFLLWFILGLGGGWAGAQPPNPPAGGSAIFLHPDGAATALWMGLRFLDHGPDGRTQWDRLPHAAVYDGRNSDTLTSSSNGGATIHAYGVRVHSSSFGNDAGQPVAALSGFKGSLMQEALAAGKAAGIVNSAVVMEPGTGAFLASAPSRKHTQEIARQISGSGTQVILGGGEEDFLPKGAKGRHGPGRRDDGRDLVADMRAKGYAVVYTREELLAVDPAKTPRLLGLFAASDTYNEYSEEQLQRAGLPAYQPQAPTAGEMVQAALSILGRHPAGFLLVMNEEGTDDFSGENNAAAVFEAARRADSAIGAAREFIARRPDTLLVVTSDSAAGGMQLLAQAGDELKADDVLPPVEENGAPVDGLRGTGSEPFLSAPDVAGVRYPFYVAWAARNDGSGNVVARAEGRHAEQLRGNVDNIGIYRLLYHALFGRPPAPQNMSLNK
jgi:alkaline phosphatase